MSNNNIENNNNENKTDGQFYEQKQDINDQNEYYQPQPCYYQTQQSYYNPSHGYYPPQQKTEESSEFKEKLTTNSYKWVAFDGTIPENALGLNNRNGKIIYVARASIYDGLHPGYADPETKECYTSYGGEQIACKEFEILTVPPNGYQWELCENANDIQGNPIIGGHEDDNTEIYIAKCIVDDILYIGKTSKDIEVANYGSEGVELTCENFEVLIYPPGAEIIEEENVYTRVKKGSNDPVDAPYKWEPFTGTIPEDAVGIKNNFGNTIYVARAYLFDGLHPGYADPKKMKCYTSYGGEQKSCDEFEILTIPSDKYQWTPCINANDINGNPVIGGYEDDNSDLYVAKCMYHGNIPCIGKTSKTLEIAYYGLLNKELPCEEFEVLTYIYF
jgi:hypothetical protein